MDVVEVAAAVLAAREVAPSEPADLTPLVRAADGVQTLFNTSPAANIDQPFAQYVAASIDLARVDYWTGVLHRDVHDAGRYRPILAGTPDYPWRLAQVWDAPPLLFVRGTLADDYASAVAIIGSRATGEDTVAATVDLAFALAGRGVDVVSGLAAGVDGAAHRGALAAGGHTTAVMGTGIEVVFPPQHDHLAEQVAGRGALVSEFPPYAPHTASSFLRRNGTIAAMSDVLVVMDAATRSGSRQAVRRAVEYGRPIMIWEPTLGHATWAEKLVADGTARFFDAPTQVLGALPTGAR